GLASRAGGGEQRAEPATRGHGCDNLDDDEPGRVVPYRGDRAGERGSATARTAGARQQGRRAPGGGAWPGRSFAVGRGRRGGEPSRDGESGVASARTAAIRLMFYPPARGGSNRKSHFFGPERGPAAPFPATE